jgi:hypothetical protein
MLHPTEKKLSESKSLEEMILEFRMSGGSIEKISDNVSSHLRKSKYVNKI